MYNKILLEQGSTITALIDPKARMQNVFQLTQTSNNTKTNIHRQPKQVQFQSKLFKKPRKINKLLYFDTKGVGK